MKNNIIAALLCFFSLSIFAQQTNLKAPEASQAASVTQRIGLTDITIKYHSPLAKGRKIWGDLVPYGEVWRAGANENTTITFSTDVKVEGGSLPAGTYGLHMIPTASAWTIIFSKNADAWGSFFYNQQEDALRVNVNPRPGAHQDWLSYTFADPQPKSVSAVLHWEKLEVPMKIEVDVPETVVQSMKKELTGVNGFFWQGYNQIAAYSVRNNIHMDEAAAWADRSIQIKKTFANMNTKAIILEKQGKATEAASLRKEALAMANEEELNAYGYELVAKGNMNEAIDLFRQNVKQYPNSWNVYDSLGEALLMSGNKSEAKENYKTALAKAPADQKGRIEGILQRL